MIRSEMILKQKMSELALWSLRRFSSTSLPVTSVKLQTAGIIVIGDEVLKGQVQDTNTHFLATKLHSFGIKLVKVAVVSDDVNLISAQVREFSTKFDYVLTTGGIGPTHDDVTYESVARAFNDELYYHPDLVEMCFKFYRTKSLDHPALKLAFIPRSAKLLYGYDVATESKSLYPNISVQNVYIFPGVPILCQRMFNFASTSIFSKKNKFSVMELYLNVTEEKIVDQLNEAVHKFPAVTFGSYPVWFHSYYSVKLTMESLVKNDVNSAFDWLKNKVPVNFQVAYDPDPYSDKHRKFSKVKFSNIIKLNLVMSDFTNILKENRTKCYLWFDGGKNSTLLLHLLAVACEDVCPNNEFNVICLKPNPNVNKFIKIALKNYNVNIMTINDQSLSCFCNSDPNIVLIKGTRESDPAFKGITKHLEYLQIKNIYNPLLTWSYYEVWEAITSLCIPYCDLYNKGYTCIHGTCKPNEALLTEGPRNDIKYYKKAHELHDASLE